MGGPVSCFCHPCRATGLPAFRIPRDSVRDARTAFATRCPPGRAERGWARVAVWQMRDTWAPANPGVWHADISRDVLQQREGCCRQKLLGQNLPGCTSQSTLNLEYFSRFRVRVPSLCEQPPPFVCDALCHCYVDIQVKKLNQVLCFQD